MQRIVKKIVKFKDITTTEVYNIVADELAKKPEVYSGYYTGLQIVVEGQGILHMPNYLAYVEKTRKPGTFTDHAEWQAARNAFPVSLIYY